MTIKKLILEFYSHYVIYIFTGFQGDADSCGSDPTVVAKLHHTRITEGTFRNVPTSGVDSRPYKSERKSTSGADCVLSCCLKASVRRLCGRPSNGLPNTLEMKKVECKQHIHSSPGIRLDNGEREQWGETVSCRFRSHIFVHTVL